MTARKKKKKAPLKKASAMRKKAAVSQRNVQSEEIPAEEPYQSASQSAYGDDKAICMNVKCKLRKGGCKGFEGCPGFLK